MSNKEKEKVDQQSELNLSRRSVLSTGAALAGGVTDSCSEIANTQHCCMPRLLKSSEFAKQNAVSQMDITTSGINTKLDPQGSVLFSSLIKTSRKLLISIPPLA